MILKLVRHKLSRKYKFFHAYIFDEEFVSRVLSLPLVICHTVFNASEVRLEIGYV